MPTSTTLEQTGTVTANADGSTTFTLLSTVTYAKPGDLPQTAVFVYEIVDSQNPKADVFRRVGSVIDITGLTASRDMAIAQGATNYLASSCTLDYEDVASAVAAKQVLQARVDDLVGQWVLYNGQFAGVVDTTMPLSSSSVYKAAKAKYVEARDARDVAESTLAAARATLTQSEKDADALTILLGQRSADYLGCTQVQTIITAIVSGELSFITAMQSFRAASSTYLDASKNLTGLEDASAIYADALNVAGQALSDENSGLRANILAAQSFILSECGQKKALYAQVQNDKAAADAALAAASTEVSRAEAATAAAAVALDTALVEAKTLCPTFDPSTV